MSADDLIQLGFIYAGSCNCGGGFTKKYKRGEWMIYLTSKSFKVKRNGSTIKGFTAIEGLEGYISKALPFLFARK